MAEEYEIQLIGRLNAVTLYSVRNMNESFSEFHKFMLDNRNKANIRKDFDTVMEWIKKISECGALERYFRPESKIGDNVCAIPVESNALRLYALRISDEILILGNGGIKQSETYNEDPVLNKHVTLLAEIDRKIKNKVIAGNLQIGTGLSGIDKVKFHINF